MFYFIQGINEPTEGLIAQPVRSLLKSWGQNAEQIATFSALLAMPWALKPVYGLISDFIPLAGYYRKSYLVLASAITSISLGLLYARDLPTGEVNTLMALLILPTIGVAFSDVVVDALMVEKGQPRGLTGVLQSVQWSAIYAATILTGSWGGYLSAHASQQDGFLICALLTLFALVLSLTVVREKRSGHSARDFANTWQTLRQAVRSRTILAVGAFLFCWHFNPFSTTVLYMYMTRGLNFGEQFYGNSVSLIGVGAMVGSLLYGFYCRRVPMAVLIHVSVVMGILSTVAYWLMRDEASAAVISLAIGFTTGTGLMVQFDLAARACPPRTAGTLFAGMMSLMNLAMALSTWLGGWCYERMLETWGNPLAFNVLVGIGASFTALCWLVVPYLKHEQPPATLEV